MRILATGEIFMIVSIGILAYNEEKYIRQTLLSLFQQSVFHEPQKNPGVTKWDIVIVPNGCQDNTASMAQTTLDKLVREVETNADITYQVTELPEAGKANAWNVAVHELTDKKSSMIIMIDADIIFNHPDTIYNAIVGLQQDQHACVSVGSPLKSFIEKEKKSFIEKISINYSRQKQACQAIEKNPGIAGSFYCARSGVLRGVWMPPGLSGEDGFLRAMVCTDFFRTEPDHRKIIRVPNASHYYEGLTSIREIFKHELRMVIGTSMNCYFCWDFLLFATDPNGPGAGALIKSRLELDPDWYKRYIENCIKNRGLWVLPRGMLTSRFSLLKNKKIKFPLQLIVFPALFLLYFPILLIANYKLKKGAIGYW